jgi:D-glycero-D-manno-heptose 1,7-bisphosphate phosphatase
LLNSIEHTVSFTITPNLYYSLSNSNRIPKVFRYLDKSRRVILLDRDGTINKKAPKGEYVLEYNQFEWIRDSKELFYYLRVKNCEVFILTNQPAVGRNIVSKSDIDSLHSLIAGEIFRSQGRLDGIFACLHGWDDSCNCRKPNIGLFVLVQELFDIDWSRTLYIGDDERDREAAAKLGIKFALVDEDTLRIDDIVKPWLESFESEELL